MVDLLVKANADVNIKAKNGLTPMHLCAQEDKVDVAKLLVSSSVCLSIHLYILFVYSFICMSIQYTFICMSIH